jgi:oligopeptide/dipeptide ABC transporter ATP-binding protein
VAEAPRSPGVNPTMFGRWRKETLMQMLQDKYQLTYLWISHNLDQIQYMCDSMAVMYLGKIVETGETKDVMKNPTHPYTKALLSAIPKVGSGRRRKQLLLTGELPSPINPPSGCRFRTRCKYVMTKCAQVEPLMVKIDGNHRAACHLFSQS